MKDSKFLMYFIFIIILLLPIIWISYLLFFWWWFWMMYEVPGRKLTEEYLTIWNYTIWKQKWFYNICSNWSWCLNWKVLGCQQNNNEVYIYIDINYWNWIIWNKKFYSYTLYKWNSTLFSWAQLKNNDFIIYNLNELPKYWYLSNNELKIYSESDLKDLSQEQQNIFKELEKNPRVVINWVDYTK